MSLSQNTVEFADRIRNRLLGNSDDQSVLQMNERPRRRFVTGVIYTARDQSALLQYHEYKSKVTPNSYSVELGISEDRFKVSVKISFWLWFQSRQEAVHGAPMGDLYSEEVLWTPWQDRISSSSDQPAAVAETGNEESDEDDEPAERSKYVFVRKRYCKVLEFGFDGITTLGKTRDKPWKDEQSLDEDLRNFGKANSHLGTFPRWRGSVMCQAWAEKGLPKVKITVVNLTQDRKGEPCWFDARMMAGTDKALTTIDLPEFQQPAKAVTNNCILDFDSAEDNRSVRLEQVGMLTIKRMHPIPSVTFKEVAEDPLAAAKKVIYQLEVLPAHQSTVSDTKNALDVLTSDPMAVKAVSLTSLVFYNYFLSKQRPNAQWHLFQITTLLNGAREFLESSSIPIVENVPTNAGKTEAFLSCMLFATLYGRLTKRRVVNVVKYPYRMLSRQQKERIATYMIFAEEIAAKNRMDDLILGYFAGMTRSSKPGQSGQSTIIDEVSRKCPLCKSDWEAPRRLYDSDEAASLECKSNRHKLIMATGDAVFSAAPSIIIATPDKFVAKCYKDKMGSILGSLTYQCSVHGYTVHNKCEKLCSGKVQQVNPIRVGFWTLDESHLIREEEGTKDTHYEKGHTDIARFNSGVHTIPIISTATISGIDHFIKHLGFGRTYIMIPASNDREKFLEADTSENEIQHAVVVIEPRNRATVFALAKMVEEWVNVSREKGVQIGENNGSDNKFSHLSHMMLYFPSYDKLYQTWDQLVNDVNKTRSGQGLRELRIREATGRLNETEIEEWFRLVQQRAIDVTLATKLASIGIDVETLNVLGFYGVPTQMSEFVQVLNRTARRSPGLAFIVLDPGKERDRSYYDYMDLFVTKAGSLVEEIPLNRFARSAIRYTFNNVLFSLLLFHFGPKNNNDYRRVPNVLADLNNGKLSEEEIIARLREIFLVSEDETGAYTPLVDELWKDFKLSLSSPGVTYIWDKYWGTKWLPNSLRGTADQEVTIVSDKTVDDAMYFQLFAARASEDESEDDDAIPANEAD